MIRVNPGRCPSVEAEAAQSFADRLLSEAGQAAIAAHEIVGQLVFPHAPET